MKCFSIFFSRTKHTQSHLCIHSFRLPMEYICHTLTTPYCVFMHANTHTCTYTLTRKVKDMEAGSSVSHLAHSFCLTSLPLFSLCLVPWDVHIEKPFTVLLNYSCLSVLPSFSLVASLSILSVCHLLISSVLSLSVFLSPPLWTVYSGFLFVSNNSINKTWQWY